MQRLLSKCKLWAKHLAVMLLSNAWTALLSPSTVLASSTLSSSRWTPSLPPAGTLAGISTTPIISLKLRSSVHAWPRTCRQFSLNLTLTS